MTYIIGLGTPNDPEALKLETRARRFIHNVTRPEGHPDIMRERIRITQDAFPAVVPVSASIVYNCYGLAFAARRCAIVDKTDVETILEDDGYRKLPWDPAAWLVGDVVLYVLSAWGDSGEYLHPIDVVSPLLGRPSEVVSQRFLV